MLSLFDNLLRQILMDGVTGLGQDVEEGQVRFQPPDTAWRGQVANMQRNALNLYLVDLRENRKLRSNERRRTVANGLVSQEQAPARLDCHYLITAWSPAELTPQTEPTLDEHTLLYEAAAVLIRQTPFNPSQVYPADSAALEAWPERFRQEDLPAVAAPVEGFNKLSEFWTTMGPGAPWKPALYLVVTIPVELIEFISGPLVTTRITEYRRTGRPDTAEEWIQIAGTVTGPDGRAVAGAWIGLDPGDHAATTNDAGRFTFVRLRRGDYTLTVRARGFAAVDQPIEVPSPGGGYDIQLS